MSGQVRCVGWSAVAGVLLAAVGGCLQLETRIRVHMDGSATITERLRFSERLLDMGREAGSAKDVAPLLTKEATLTRMKQMGKGIRLVSHEVRDVGQGAGESVAVFKIPDISDFTYVSPYLAVSNYPKHHVLKCSMFPVYSGTWWGRRPGDMGVAFKPATQERRRGGKTEPPPPPSPVSMQDLRDLQPLFRDLMQGLQIRITFESYAPLRFRTYYRYRGRLSMTKEYDLINFSDKDLDNYGAEFLANPEIMLDLLRARIGGPNVLEHTKGHADNPTLPVYHPSGTPEIYFRPSRQLFDRYFKGKTLHFDERHGGDRPAKFEQIGFKGTPTTKKAGR